MVKFQGSLQITYCALYNGHASRKIPQFGRAEDEINHLAADSLQEQRKTASRGGATGGAAVAWTGKFLANTRRCGGRGSRGLGFALPARRDSAAESVRNSGRLSPDSLLRPPQAIAYGQHG